VEQAKGSSWMSYRDLFNHLSNNLGRGERYNRDWPTGGFLPPDQKSAVLIKSKSKTSHKRRTQSIGENVPHEECLKML
jgi:hypothetical protein